MLHKQRSLEFGKSVGCNLAVVSFNSVGIFPLIFIDENINTNTKFSKKNGICKEKSYLKFTVWNNESLSFLYDFLKPQSDDTYVPNLGLGGFLGQFSKSDIQ